MMRRIFVAFSVRGGFGSTMLATSKPTPDRKATVAVLFLFLTTLPVHAFVKTGESLQMPGGAMAGVVIDENHDGVPDGVDFDGDGRGELGLVMVDQSNAVGVSEQKNGTIDFYLIRGANGEITAASSLENSAVTLSTSAGRKYAFWAHKRVGLAGNYSSTPVAIFDKKMGARGVSIFFIQGLDDFAFFKKMNKGKRMALLPGLRAELQYLSFNASTITFQGLSALVGPQWILPEMGNHAGRFVVGVEMGIFAFQLKGLGIDEKALTTTGQLLFGYEYPFGSFDLSFNLRSGLMVDRSPVLLYGAELGVSYSF